MIKHKNTTNKPIGYLICLDTPSNPYIRKRELGRVKIRQVVPERAIVQLAINIDVYSLRLTPINSRSYTMPFAITDWC